MEEGRAQYLDPKDWHSRPCWQVKECPAEWRERCPAWQYDAGHYCWEINGTYCEGVFHGSLKQKKMLCLHCSVFESTLSERTGK